MMNACTYIIALGRLRQKDYSEFAGLGCRVRPHFKKTNLKVSLLQELIHGPSVTLGGMERLSS